MFKFWGDGSQAAKDLVDAIKVRSTENFNWTFIFILAIVFYVYWQWPCDAGLRRIERRCSHHLPSGHRPPQGRNRADAGAHYAEVRNSFGLQGRCLKRQPCRQSETHRRHRQA